MIMGRVTFETVLEFGIDWPYEKPVFVLSTTLSELPCELDGKVELISGDLSECVAEIQAKGYENLYIDGGQVVKNFLCADLIDELILTRLPVVLGGGTSLFGEMETPLAFELVKSEIFLGAITQSHYRRSR